MEVIVCVAVGSASVNPVYMPMGWRRADSFVSFREFVPCIPLTAGYAVIQYVSLVKWAVLVGLENHTCVLCLFSIPFLLLKKKRITEAEVSSGQAVLYLPPLMAARTALPNPTSLSAQKKKVQHRFPRLMAHLPLSSWFSKKKRREKCFQAIIHFPDLWPMPFPLPHKQRNIQAYSKWQEFSDRGSLFFLK